MIDKGFRHAVDVLRAGGTVAYPTDTVYGLGAHGLQAQAVRKVFQAKQRPLDTPVPLLVADLEMLRSVVDNIPEIGMELIQRFMPGPLTLVLKRACNVPDEVTAGGETVGVRIPNHPVPIALAAALGAPLVGTSANRSGLPSATTAADVRSQLGDAVDWVVDGQCWGKQESTIIDVTGPVPRVLRKGALLPELLAEFLNRDVAGRG